MLVPLAMLPYLPLRILPRNMNCLIVPRGTFIAIDGSQGQQSNGNAGIPLQTPRLPFFPPKLLVSQEAEELLQTGRPYEAFSQTTKEATHEAKIP